MAYNRINYLNRVHEIQQFARQFYEPGRQDRSWAWVWKNRVYPAFCNSRRTFTSYMSIDVERALSNENAKSKRVTV